MLLKFVRERSQLAVQRNDFKLDTVPAHLFMNLRVVDEHSRQLAMGHHTGLAKVAVGRAGAQCVPGLGHLEARARSGEQCCGLAPTR